MRRLRERHPVLVGLVATLVAVAAVVAVLAAVVPQRLSPADAEQVRLERGHAVIDQALADWRDSGHRAVTTMRSTSGGGLLIGGPRSDSLSRDLPTGVRVGFYRVDGGASAYCLASRTRHLLVQTDPTDIAVGGGRGACPRASVRPIHLAN